MSLSQHDKDEIKELTIMAEVYILSYKETGDWGFIPTAVYALEKISLIHMRSTGHHGSQSEVD